MTRAAKFDATPRDLATIKKIVRRAVALVEADGNTIDRMSLEMDIEAAHCNGNPLRLRDLLAADDFNFSHDVFGIMRHMDRTTGQLTGFFVPRYSAPRKAGAA